MGRKKISIDRDELTRLGDSGMTIKQIAEHFGCSARVINRRREEFGIKYGRGHSPANIAANHDPKRREVKNLPPFEPLGARESKFIKRLAKDPRTEMYEYIGGYKSKDEKLTVRCKKCGEQKEMTPGQLFDGRIGHHVCLNCLRITREREGEERRAALREHEAEEFLKDKTCKTCGRIYHSKSDTSKYCSKECRRKRKDHSHRGRARYYGVEYDPSITWKTLAKKLGHCNCQICGEPCDPSDKSWAGSFGSLYPTVDCIVAMKNGGGYVWDNVQLAHAMCNSAKRDLVSDCEIAEAVNKHAPNGGCYQGRHAPGTAQDARIGDSEHNRHGRRVAQHGATCEAVPRDDTRDCRVGSGIR